MNTLLQKQDALHTEATALLEEILVPILQKYGSISVGGSYLYKLLNHPDLDIDVVNENFTKDMFAQLSAELIALSDTSKFKSADRVIFPHTNPGKRPSGYWISPEIHFGENVWTLDVWLQTPDQHTGDTSRYEQELLGLDDDARITILSLKEELINKNLYGVGKEFVSVDVYEGVIRKGVRSVEDLRKCMANSTVA